MLEIDKKKQFIESPGAVAAANETLAGVGGFIKSGIEKPANFKNPRYMAAYLTGYGVAKSLRRDPNERAQMARRIGEGHQNSLSAREELEAIQFGRAGWDLDRRGSVVSEDGTKGRVIYSTVKEPGFTGHYKRHAGAYVGAGVGAAGSFAANVALMRNGRIGRLPRAAIAAGLVGAGGAAGHMVDKNRKMDSISEEMRQRVPAEAAGMIERARIYRERKAAASQLSAREELDTILFKSEAEREQDSALEFLSWSKDRPNMDSERKKAKAILKRTGPILQKEADDYYRAKNGSATQELSAILFANDPRPRDQQGQFTDANGNMIDPNSIAVAYNKPQQAQPQQQDKPEEEQDKPEEEGSKAKKLISKLNKKKSDMKQSNMSAREELDEIRFGIKPFFKAKFPGGPMKKYTGEEAEYMARLHSKDMFPEMLRENAMKRKMAAGDFDDRMQMLKKKRSMT